MWIQLVSNSVMGIDNPKIFSDFFLYDSKNYLVNCLILGPWTKK